MRIDRGLNSQQKETAIAKVACSEPVISSNRNLNVTSEYNLGLLAALCGFSDKGCVLHTATSTPFQSVPLQDNRIDIAN